MKKTATFALCGALLAGCVSAPTTTPQYTQIAPETLGLSATPAVAISDTWWTAFGDPKLNALVEQAQAGNPSLAAALARVRTAQSAVSAARAETYPQLTFDAQDQRTYFSKSYIIPPPFAGTTQWYGTIQSNLSWSLDLFGKQQSQIDQLRASAHARELDATAARLLLAGQVTQAYIALNRAYALIDVAQETVRQQEGVLKLTAGRVTAGLETPASQRQSEALAAFARQDLVASRAARDLAVHTIAVLIGRGADAYDIPCPHLNTKALALPETLPADLLARRADVAAAQARIEAAFAGREVARKAFYPDINLVGAAGWAAIGLSPLFSAASLQYGAGPAIHLPIFDAGKIRADYAGATGDLDAAVADYNGALTNAVKQTADALTQIQSVEGQSREQATALKSAVDSFDFATERYRSGLSPQLNVLSSEDLVIRARTQSVSLASDLASARVSLVMALGGGFVPEPKQEAISNSGIFP
jgi:NodT family efflux transporter outer membrane factor (OMF) lipoprotein